MAVGSQAPGLCRSSYLKVFVFGQLSYSRACQRISPIRSWKQIRALQQQSEPVTYPFDIRRHSPCSTLTAIWQCSFCSWTRKSCSISVQRNNLHLGETLNVTAFPSRSVPFRGCARFITSELFLGSVSIKANRIYRVTSRRASTIRFILSGLGTYRYFQMNLRFFLENGLEKLTGWWMDGFWLPPFNSYGSSPISCH